MAGTQTHGFDMVIEISAQTIQNLLSATFDSDGLLGSIIPGNIGILEGFGLTVSFSRPSGIPASAINPVQLLFNINFTNSTTGTLEVVVGMDVDRSDPHWDKIILDFVDKTYRCTLTVPGIPAAITGVAAAFIQNKLENHTITLIPVPVNRTGTGTTTIIRADVKVIDDTSVSNSDALGIILTYGGGGSGNLNDFTKAFSRDGAGAAVAINFAWICRNISPRIESGIGLPAGSFAGCSFNGEFEIKDGVKLTNMSVTPANDHIVLHGRVAKSGTCYEANGSFTARISVSIVGGELRVSFEADDPDINMDIPWYCWLGAAVLGAILGGVIFGVIGAIVGGIIVPLLLWIAQSVIESTIENVTSQVTDAINGIDDINVQLVGIDTILDSAFIDDLTVTYDMHPKEYWPVKSEGTVTLINGIYIDLDNGIVKNELFGGADLKLEGSGQSRSLKVLCGSSCTVLNTGKSFDHIRRFDLLMLSYGFSGNLPLYQFATYIPIPFIVDQYFETFKIFAVKTSDNSYGFFQVISVTKDVFVIRYKTYKSDIYTIDFSGNFSCKPYHLFDENIRLENVDYIDAFTINSRLSDKLRQSGQILKTAELSRLSALNTNSLRMMLMEDPNATASQDFKVNLLKTNKAAGNWTGYYTSVRNKKTASLIARVNGNLTVKSYSWLVDGHDLGQNASGTVKVKSQDFQYTTNGKILTLASKSGATLEVPVKLIITFDNGISDYIIKCLPYKNDCKTTRHFVPALTEYLEKFDNEYGIVMV